MAQELHIKIPDEQDEFLKQFKKDHGVSKQEFIVQAIQDKILILKTK